MTPEGILAAVHAAIFRDKDTADLPEILRDVVGLRNEAQRTRDGILAALDAIREPPEEILMDGVKAYCSAYGEPVTEYFAEFSRRQSTGGVRDAWRAQIDALKREISALGRKVGESENL